MAKIIRFINDNLKFDIDYYAIIHISDVIRELCYNDDRNIIEIKLNDINGVDNNNHEILLNLVNIYASYYKNKIIAPIEKPLKNDISDVISDWDKFYLKQIINDDNIIDKSCITIMHQLIELCNYLSIKPLLYLLCAKMASILRNKTSEEIKYILKIE